MDIGAHLNFISTKQTSQKRIKSTQWSDGLKSAAAGWERAPTAPYHSRGAVPCKYCRWPHGWASTTTPPLQDLAPGTTGRRQKTQRIGRTLVWQQQPLPPEDIQGDAYGGEFLCGDSGDRGGLATGGGGEMSEPRAEISEKQGGESIYTPLVSSFQTELLPRHPRQLLEAPTALLHCLPSPTFAVFMTYWPHSHKVILAAIRTRNLLCENKEIFSCVYIPLQLLDSGLAVPPRWG